jgi:O-antigen/teichoic acid export membrane protein
MLIVNSVRSGIELLSDVGITQNIVSNKNGNDPEFYNTAWTIQAIRSLILWLVALVIAVPVARFYQTPILAYIVPIICFGMVFGGFSSVGRELLHKRMQIARLNAFELLTVFISSAAFVLFAYLSPTIWAAAWGTLFSGAFHMIGSYFLLPGITQRFQLSKQFSYEIVHFGKWIFASSLLYFVSTNFDRLYLATSIPLELLGIYGIARSISETLGLLVLRLGSQILFPLIASHSQTSRDDLREQLAPVRSKFFFIAVALFSLFAATADIPIKILYDERYQAATWILPLLIIGSWFSILTYLNESTLLGLGKPSYNAASNALKFTFLVVGLPLSFKVYGLIGGIMIIVFADLVRYIPILIGQKREHFSFGKQDFLFTLAVLLLIAFWEGIRWISGFGTSFDSFPIEIK